MKLRCIKCGAPATTECDCGVACVPTREYAKRHREYLQKILEENSGKGTRTIAGEIGEPETTLRRIRKKQGAPNGAPAKRKGKDNKSYPASRQQEPYMGATIIPAAPLGEIPGDAREKMQEYVDAIHYYIEMLLKMSWYAEQMSPELRHLMADNLRGLSNNLKLISHNLLGHKDWRKISRPYCDEEIPLRAEDTKWN